MSPAIDTKFTPDQIQQFKRDGFISIGQLVDDQTLAALRTEYDRFISGEIKCGEDNRLLGGLIHQVMYPSRYSPFIRDNPAVRTAKVMAAQLLDAPDSSNIEVRFDMLIDKPAGTAKETPWHQDYAYSDRPMMPAGTRIPKAESVQFWVALDDVDLENGCMQFAPGFHVRPLLPHRVMSGDPNAHSRLLTTDEIDLARVAACPLRAGGCTVHHYGTPHYTGPNKTLDRNRRAYIFNLHWPQPETLWSRTFGKLRMKPTSWMLATMFLWLPLVILGLQGTAQVLFQNSTGSKGLVRFLVWCYPVVCAICAGRLFFTLTGRKRLVILPTLAAIPLWGLAFYYLAGGRS